MHFILNTFLNKNFLRAFSYHAEHTDMSSMDLSGTPQKNKTKKKTNKQTNKQTILTYTQFRLFFSCCLTFKFW